MMRPQLVAMAFVMVLAAVCDFGTGSLVEVPGVTQAPPPPPRNPNLRNNQTRSRMPNNFRSYTIPTSPPKCDYREMMTNLHDRVGILVTLDEDQRHRLEIIDKKLDELVDSSSARMESMKAQQLDFKQRLDSFEHIQRLSRNTLDELKGETDLVFGSRHIRELKHKLNNRKKMKDLSRTPRAVQDPESEPTRASNESYLSVSDRLDALATLLTSTALQVRSTQIEVNSLSKVIKRQNRLIQGKLGHKSPGAPPSIFYGPAGMDGPPNSQDLPNSCKYHFLSSQGILKLQLTPESESFYVTCDDDWTVILSRSSDDVNFERGWLDYRDGFGNLAGNFFIGLNKLHALTASALHELRIVMEDFSGNVAYAGYSVFAIGSEREIYPLSVLGKFQEDLTPSAGDSLSYHAGAKFSTLDQDNDNCLDCNCAAKHKGAGWFNNCATSNLFGHYIARNQGQALETGMWWDTFAGQNSLKSVRWMIRPVPDFLDDNRR
ncbi:fibrinogen C domain-containing protein 1 isoform X1 [Drosophila takahashii]|uniref:fibrinogen C domain-containing protein 1 isoform X1 n=1 Tax=Drosophila takahashii TaxID=29030 RepID=UPI001CF84A81|nr:fibrinogen C domain-containing protein 1 isoform X2 [Drosophila takahashii]